MAASFRFGRYTTKLTAKLKFQCTARATCLYGATAFESRLVAMERPRSLRQPEGFLALLFTWNISRNETPVISLTDKMNSVNSHAKTSEDSNMNGVFGLDAYAPKEIAEKI